MGTSISQWDGATAYFIFANSPLALVLFALLMLVICVGLIALIKRHEDKAFAKYTSIAVKNSRHK
ncbi:hypothetical protein [Sessilibacter sp. MAH2]